MTAGGAWSVIDISRYQHPTNLPIDYAAAVKSGVRAVVCESKDEAGAINPFFAQDEAGFRAAGAGFGGYVFGRPGVSQAEHATDLEAILRVGPAWLDAELAGESDAWTAEILAAVHNDASSYVPPYMGYNAAGPWPWTVGAGSPGKLRQVGTGTVPGISGLVDLDVFEGTFDELASCFRIPGPKPPRPVPGEKVVGMAGCSTGGYWLAGEAGEVCNFGKAPFLGSLQGRRLPAPVVGIEACGPRGYWLYTGDGGVFPFGNAAFDGSIRGLLLKQ